MAQVFEIEQYYPDPEEGGQRVDPAVSMIDVLPTLLDLLELPPTEITQDLVLYYYGNY